MKRTKRILLVVTLLFVSFATIVYWYNLRLAKARERFDSQADVRMSIREQCLLPDFIAGYLGNNIPEIFFRKEVTSITVKTGAQAREALRRLSSCRYLALSEMDLTGADLSFLKELSQLQSLELINSPLGKQQLEQLSTATSLPSMDLTGNGLSKEDVDRLKTALPHCVFRE